MGGQLLNSTITSRDGLRSVSAVVARTRCVDVIIRSNGSSDTWAQGVEPWMLPTAGGTLIHRLIEQLGDALDPTITWAGPADATTIKNQIAECKALTTLRRVDNQARGSAGRLKDQAGALSGGPILVIDGAVWLDDDVSWMIRQHRASRNALTVYCVSKPITLRGKTLTHIEPVSIYCCEPHVADYVADSGTQDIVTHLVPALQRAGERVGVVTLRGDTREVCTWDAYLTVLSSALKRDLAHGHNDYVRIAPNVWRHVDATVAPSARFVGPVLVEKGCRIGARAVIVGPVLLGPGCEVEPNARIVRTVATKPVRFTTRPVVSDRLVIGSGSAGESTNEPSVPGDKQAPAAAMGGVGDLVVPVGSPAGHPMVFGVLMIAVALLWALSGTAATFWQAWAESGH